jgi:hypothetical protein
MAAPDIEFRGAEPRRIDSRMIGAGSANTSGQARLFPTLHMVLGCALLLSACHPKPDNHPAPPPADNAQTSYMTPPRVIQVARLDNGGVVLSGHTDPEARVRLQSPGGPAYGVTAGADGTWTLSTPPVQTVRLLGISEVVGSRAVQSEGYLAVIPGPGQPAVMLRSGGGSHAIAPTPTAPWIAAVDFDAGGGAVISGLAKPKDPVRVSIDGASAGEARPDAEGRFSVELTAMLRPGSHHAEAQSAGGSGHVDFAFAPPPPISGIPFVGQRQANDWRIDWLTPGGAPQTTLAFDPPKAGR